MFENQQLENLPTAEKKISFPLVESSTELPIVTSKPDLVNAYALSQADMAESASVDLVLSKGGSENLPLLVEKVNDARKNITQESKLTALAEYLTNIAS